MSLAHNRAQHAMRLDVAHRVLWLEPGLYRKSLSALRHGALIAFASRPCFGQRLKGFGIQHNDGPMFEANPAAGGPNPQLLVDAFPGHADHLAELLLGNGDGSAPRRELVFFGQPNKRAGEPAGQVLKDDLFDLVAGPPQPSAG